MGAAEVLFRCERVVASTIERQILDDRCATPRIWVVMMNLEQARCPAPLAFSVHIGAPCSVALADLPPHIGRDASPARALNPSPRASAAPVRSVSPLAGRWTHARARLCAFEQVQSLAPRAFFHGSRSRGFGCQEIRSAFRFSTTMRPRF